MLKTVGPHLDSLCWKHQAVWCCTGCMSTQRQTGGGGRPSLCHGSWMTCQFYKEPEGDPRSDFSFPAIRRKTHQRIRAESKFLSVFLVYFLWTLLLFGSEWGVNMKSLRPCHSITCSPCFSLQPLPLGVQESHALWLQGYCTRLHYANVRCSCYCSPLSLYVSK